MKSIYIVASLFLQLVFLNAEAQILGSSTPLSCRSEEYWATTTINGSWSVTNGTITSSGSTGTAKWCNVTWGPAGSGQIKYKFFSLNVTVQTNNVNAGSINGAKTICYGASAGTLGSSSNASGGNYSYAYQWQVSSNNSSWSNISGATGTTYAPGNLTATRYYRRRVISCSQTKYTSSQKITVYGNLSAGSINGAKTICYGASANVMGNLANASGGNGSKTYQWQVSTNNSSWSNISGATGTSYAPGNLTATRYYRRRVYSCGQYKYTSSQKVTVYGNLSAGSIGNAQTLCYNGNPGTLTNTGVATGGTSRVYQWQKSTTSSTSGFSNISGATNSTYDPPALTQSTWYRRRVISGSGCGTKYTNVVKVSIYGNLVAGSIGNAQTLCYNGNPGALTNTGSVTGGLSPTYQWQKSTSSSTSGFSNISGATNSTYDPSALTQSTWYRRAAISGGGCGTKYTGAVKITIYNDLTPGTIGNAQPVCYGGDPSALSHTGAATGGLSPTYQWQKSTTSSTSGFTNIGGATNSTYDPSTLTQDTWYRRGAVSNGGCGTKYTSAVKITVYDDLTAGSIGNAQSLCHSGDPAALSNTGAATGGGSTSPTYQWQKSTTNSTSGFSNVSGATNNTYNPSTLTQTTWYRRGAISGGGCGTQYTNAIEINVADVLDPGTIAGDQQICDGDLPGDLTGTISSGGMGTPSYQWESSTDDINWSQVVGQTNATFTFNSFIESASYRRVTSNACGSETSNNVSVTLKALPDPGNIGGNTQICQETTPAAIAGTDFSHISGTTYQWQSSSGGSQWSDIANATGIIYTPSAVTKHYRRGVIKNGCTSYSAAKWVEAVQCQADAGSDQVGLNDNDPIALSGTPTGGSWSGRGVSGDTFDPELAGIGTHELTYAYSSALGGDTEDKMTFTVNFNSMTPTFLNDYAFQYRYDERQRMIEKQVPGAGTVYMVYDDRDRLVMTQDGNQRVNNEWLFTKYDELNRPVLTGRYTDNTRTTRSAMQIYVNDELELGNFDWHEIAGSAVHGYSNNAFPSVALEDDYLTVTYYDNYDFIGTGHWAENESISQPLAKTLVTGSKVSVPGQGWNEVVTLYDTRFRVSSTVSKDYQGNKDTFTNQYRNLVHARLEQTVHVHESAITSDITTIVKDFKYDHADRLEKVIHQINSETPVVILENEYNELGELTKKKLHKEAENQYSQEVDYQYNIRGWLTKINDPAVADPADYFAMQLKYDETGQYNGNIGATSWKNPFEAATNSYDYSYDPVNRIKAAQFSTTATNGADFDVSGIDYDANGNILSLKRTGTHDEQYAQLFDDLDYDYVGNQLTKVTDASNKDTGFKDGSNASEEYVYDANGNMIKDLNKGIEKIEYNHLNLPTRVEMNADGSDRIEYIYDAAGMKMAQIVYEGGVVTKRTDYQGEFIYESKDGEASALQFIQHDEGRIVPTYGGQPEVLEGYSYQYHLKDHLGNVRTTFKTTNDIDAALATFEPSDQNTEAPYFTGYDGMTKITADLFNHTSGGNTSIRLNGSANETEGIGKSLKVKPGDVIDMEVYAKYFNASNSAGWGNLLTTLVANIADPASGLASEGGGIGADAFPFADWTGKANPSGAPKAYMNYMVFDQNYVLLYQGYQQISTAAEENGSDVAHEKLSHSLTATEAGYVYIYLSNETGPTFGGTATPIDVFFDDFTVTQNHTPIVSKDDYYPFGGTFGSYTSGTENLYKYNGKEEQKETGWLDYGARMYDPMLGRFFTQDRYAEKYLDFSPYQYAANNPILYIDVNGDSINFSSILQSGGVQAVVNILSDLSEQTGLSSIGINSNGNLTYGTDDDGNAIVSTDDEGNQLGSETARGLVVDAASDDKSRINVSLRDGAGSASSDNNIGIDPSQIQGFVDGASGNLNSKTLGFGMTFLHELGHTDFAGDKSDYSSSGGNGPNVNQMNKIRKELDGNSVNRYLGKGTIYSIRSQYKGIATDKVAGKPGFYHIYIPFKGKGNQINFQGKVKKP